MNSRWTRARAAAALAALAMLAGACQQDSGLPTAAKEAGTIAAVSSNPNGSGGQRPVFFDGRQVIVNMKELPDDAAEAILESNTAVNEIYATNDLDEPQDFLSVIDAVPTAGFNPLWHQILIVWNPGFTPRQFTSEDQIDAAAEGSNPEITLVETDEVYRCSVVR